MPFARFTVHHNFEVERQFAGRVLKIHENYHGFGGMLL
jgi:hypothetical protein